MKRLLLLILSLAFVCSLSAREVGIFKSNDWQFLELAELRKMIARAKASGFTDQELSKLTLINGGIEINVLEYIRQKEEEERLKKEKLEAFRRKKFLTIQDMYDELHETEKKSLTKHREGLIGE